MKWQTAALIITIALASTGVVTYTDLYGVLFQLSGVESTYTGDQFCGTDCDSYINVTTSYWRICFAGYDDTKYENETLFKKMSRSRTLHVNLDNVDNVISTKPRVEVDWFVPARGKGNWRPIEDGDCWDRGKVNKIKLVGHKQPWETVKWSFLIEDYVDIDPLWSATATINYTSSSRTICENGVCTLRKYPSTKFGFEDDQWKAIENLSSFVNSTNIDCIVTKDSPTDTDVECLDWNYTDVRIDVKDKIKLYPIKVIDKFNKSNVKMSLPSQKLDVLNIKLGLSNELHIGKKSTTIQLRDADTENLADVGVREDNPNTNYDVDGWIGNNPGTRGRTYFMWNISQIPSTDIFITNITHYYRWGTSRVDSVHSLRRVLNITWNESNMTWNTQSCGTGAVPDAVGVCDGTISVDTASGTTTSIQHSTSELIDMFRDAYDEGNDTISLVGWNNIFVSTPDSMLLKEDGGQIPYVDITYVFKGYPKWSNNQTNATTVGESTLFSVFWNSTINISHYIFEWHNGSNWTQTDQSSDLESGSKDYRAYESSAGSLKYDIIINKGGYVRVTSADLDDDDFIGGDFGGGGNNAIGYIIFTNSTNLPTGTIITSGFINLSFQLDNLLEQEWHYFDVFNQLDANTMWADGTPTWAEYNFSNTKYELFYRKWNSTGQSTPEVYYNFTIGQTALDYLNTILVTDNGTNFTITHSSDARADSYYLTYHSGQDGDIDSEANPPHAVITYNATYVDLNQTAITYLDIFLTTYNTLNNLTVTVFVSDYNTSGSINNSNNNITLWLEVYNGSDWIDEGDFGVGTTQASQNYSIIVTTASVLTGWETELNRDIRISARYMDYNSSTLYDVINWTGVWVDVFSNQELINDSAVTFTSSHCEGTTNTSRCWSNVTKTISSTVGDTIKWRIYANSSTDYWNQTDLFEFNITSAVEDGIVTMSLLNSTDFNVSNGTFFASSFNISCATGGNDCNAGNVTLDPTIQLQAPDTENLLDTYVQKSAATTNYGTGVDVRGRDDDASAAKRVYLQFNLSIPDGATIDDARLFAYVKTINTPPVTITVHEVTNMTQTETSMTWNNQPCGVNFDVSANCNLTAESSTDFSSTGIWVNWSTTNMVARAYDSGANNVSMALFGNGDSVNEWWYFHSKEYTTDTTLRLFLNVTYTLAGVLSKGDIPEDAGNPFYVNSTFQNNPYEFSTIPAGSSIIVNWSVMPNGTVGNTYALFAYVNNTYNNVVSDIINVTIVAAEVEVSYIFVNLSNGITEIRYIVTSTTDKDVEPEGQTSIKGIFNITNNGTATTDVCMWINETYTDVETECGPNYFSSGFFNLTTSPQLMINDLTVDSSNMVWCRRDYDNPVTKKVVGIMFNTSTTNCV